MDDQSKVELREAAKQIWAITGTGSDEEMIYDRWSAKVETIIDRLLAAERTAALACVYTDVQKHLETFARDLNAGEYSTFITHTLMPIVLDTITRISPQSVEDWRKGVELAARIEEAKTVSFWLSGHTNIYYDKVSRVWVGKIGTIMSQGRTEIEAFQAVMSAFRLTMEVKIADLEKTGR